MAIQQDACQLLRSCRYRGLRQGGIWGCLIAVHGEGGCTRSGRGDGLRVVIPIEQSQNRRGLPDSKLLSFASPNESSQRKGDPGLPPLRGSLRCWLRHNLKVSLRRNNPRCGLLSTGQAAAELALRAQTVLADYPRPVSATRRRTGEGKAEVQITWWAASCPP